MSPRPGGFMSFPAGRVLGDVFFLPVAGRWSSRDGTTPRIWRLDPPARARRAGRPRGRGLGRGVLARRQGPGHRQRRHRRAPDDQALGHRDRPASGGLDGHTATVVRAGLQPEREDPRLRQPGFGQAGEPQRHPLGRHRDFTSPVGSPGGPHRLGALGRVQPGRADAGHRQRRPDGAAVGRGVEDHAGRPVGPHQERDVRRIQPGREDAGDGVQRRDGADSGTSLPVNPCDLCSTRATSWPSRSPRTARCWPRPTRTEASSSGTRPRGDLVRTIRGEADQLRCLAFTPDGRNVAAAGKGKVIRIWDIATGQELLSLEGHKAQINALAFSPDGSMLASCSHDGAVRLWRAGPIRPGPGR